MNAYDDMHVEKLQELLAHEYGRSRPFFRDTNMAGFSDEPYQKGVFLREPTFCDATYKAGGIIGRLRFHIISSNARYIDTISQHPEWGLCILSPNTMFKVIDRTEQEGKIQITLLDVPEVLLPIFQTSQLEKIETFFATQAREHFSQALRAPLLPELDTPEWKQRVSHPIGMDDNGILFSLTSLSST